MTAIGVTGHRSLPDDPAVAAAVEEALELIRAFFPCPYRLLSSLADGADRLAARRAAAVLNADLIVPLPLPADDYRRDFSPASRQDFDSLLKQAAEVSVQPARPDRAGAYEAAGRCILEKADVLLAVWNGEPARGPGGTGQVVAEARQRGLPVIRVDPDDPAAIQLERFPARRREEGS